MNHFKKTLFIIPFRKIRAALPGEGYSSRKSSATQSYTDKCMLGLFVFLQSTELSLT